MRTPSSFLTAIGLFLSTQTGGVCGEQSLTPSQTSIPFDQLGAEAQKSYKGGGTGITPTAPDARVLTPGTGAAGLPSITVPSPGVLRIEFIRRIGSGLIYAPKKSTTLDSGSWSAIAATPTITPTITPISSTWERVTYDEPYTPGTTFRFFGQVDVTLP